MKFELFSRVALSVDIPKHHLKRGDVATVVEQIEPGLNMEPGYVLEVFNAIGETVAVPMVAESEIEPLRENELLQVRSFEAELQWRSRKFKLFTQVAFAVDISEHYVKKDDIATLVEYFDKPRPGYAFDVYNAIGESIGVVAVPKLPSNHS
jgi:hypothetical protein